jgi:hypothetical protein
MVPEADRVERLRNFSSSDLLEEGAWASKNFENNREVGMKKPGKKKL